jgi:hypothetical protein
MPKSTAVPPPSELEEGYTLYPGKRLLGCRMGVRSLTLDGVTAELPPIAGSPGL